MIEQLPIGYASFLTVAVARNNQSNFNAQKELFPAFQIKYCQNALNQLISKLSETEDELANIVQILYASSDPILITDPGANIIFVNAAWEKLTGYTFDEVKGKNPRILQSGKTPKHVYEAMWKALLNKQPFTTEEKIDKRKDGSEYQIHSAVFPVLRQGKVIYYVQLQHDITERKRQESLVKFQGQIIQNMAEGVCLVNVKDATIVYTNPKFDKMFAYEPGELQNKPVHILNYAQNAKGAAAVARNIIKKLKESGEATYEIQNIKKDGTPFWCNATTSEFNHPEFGKVWIAVHQDITEKKRIEELRKEFLSAAAHELKTPITVLKLLSQRQLTSVKSNNNGISRNEIELMNSEINRLTGLIDDILDSSRFETGKLFFKFERINLTELIRKTIKKMKVYGYTHTIVIHDIPEEMYVTADSARIEQVLLNLLSNAVKYSPEESTITVTAQKNKKELVIGVQDQGEGISEEKQGMIFDKYYQVKAREQKGFGLGLYISKEIISKHKGKIWVESKKGKGSTFFISLPN